MLLEEALKASAVVRALDRTYKVTGGVAKRPYPQISGLKDKCLLAFSLTSFQIAWEGTYEAIQIGINPDFDVIFKYDDWEPI